MTDTTPHYGNGAPKLSDDTVRAIRGARGAGHGIGAKLARVHGVNPSTIYGIWSGELRADVPDEAPGEVTSMPGGDPTQAVITAAARAVWAAERYYQCLGEFDGDPEPCVEWDDASSEAMVQLSDALDAASVDWRDPAVRVRPERAQP